VLPVFCPDGPESLLYIDANDVLIQIVALCSAYELLRIVALMQFPDFRRDRIIAKLGKFDQLNYAPTAMR
jgi:hypothetical protein